MPSALRIKELRNLSDNVLLDNGTLTNNVVFPAGHVIQTVTDQYVSPSTITVTTSLDDYLGSNLECTITPTKNGNKLLIQAFIHGYYNNGQGTRSLFAGFAYDANFSSGNGTTVGPRTFIADHHGYLTQSNDLLTNLQYSIVVSVGTQAPSEGSASIIRPLFRSPNGDILIASNTAGSHGVFSMMVMEIQA